MARQPGQKPTEAQRSFTKNIFGANPNGIKAARQKAQSRSFVYDPSERYVVKCEQCGGPRDPKKHPICEQCTRRRIAGLR